MKVQKLQSEQVAQNEQYEVRMLKIKDYENLCIFKGNACNFLLSCPSILILCQYISSFIVILIASNGTNAKSSKTKSLVI
ncbi:hypothetical protein M6B38_364865 [Iris pallida]|uniref:Uncharacterized protein n=1 Tax=Iris pallida TaxID=29817 RepID=A0AAX6GH96_IRIPA|nr:hypothetical protein M6B38_364865 [Iris pallida]